MKIQIESVDNGYFVEVFDGYVKDNGDEVGNTKLVFEGGSIEEDYDALSRMLREICEQCGYISSKHHDKDLLIKYVPRETWEEIMWSDYE